MSAGSLVDVNALPSWLRAVDSQPQGQQGQQAAGNAPGTAPRIESMRVPVRPRAEMMPPEQSEVAANVFSSVLGVASVSPQYPAPTPAGQQGFAGMPAGPSGPLYGAQPAPPMGVPPVFNNEQAMPSGSMPGGYAGNYPRAYPNNNPAMQNPYGANQGQPVPQQPSAIAMQTGGLPNGQNSSPNPENANARPGKRSFLDTIREWFHH